MRLRTLRKLHCTPFVFFTAFILAARAQQVASPDCSATVDPVAQAGDGLCVAIVPCLAKMSGSCAHKALTLAPGNYSGPQNTQIVLSNAESVAIVGPAAPFDLRLSAGGAPLDAVVSTRLSAATIDGQAISWLFAVEGNASLRLQNVVLARGRAPLSLPNGSSASGQELMGGGAVRVLGRGSLHAESVMFDGHAALPHGAGGAVFTNSTGTVILSGCVFTASNAFKGGAVYITGDAIDGAIVVPIFYQTLFESNTAEDNGGGVYISGVRSARFDACTWLANSAAKRGGGLVVYTTSIHGGTLVSPTFDSCIFENNHARKNGGGARIRDASPVFVSCVWRNNVASGGQATGGAVIVYSSSNANATDVRPTFQYNVFESNRAGDDGGGTYIENSAPNFTQCNFSDNVAVHGRGGGAYIFAARAGVAPSVSPMFDACSFNSNSAAGDGGGTYVRNAAPLFSGCDWHNNRAAHSGGALYILSTSPADAASVTPSLDACRFDGNSAGGGGGGVQIRDAAPHFHACAWQANSAMGRRNRGGGAVSVLSTTGSHVRLVFSACVFNNNEALGSEGGGAFALNVAVTDAPANLAFIRGSCNDFVCNIDDSTLAVPPPVVNGTFRQWVHRVQVMFSNGVTFDGNSAHFVGGAISASGGGSISVLNNASFRGNRAKVSGGALNIGQGTTSFSFLGTTSEWMGNFAQSARGDHIYSKGVAHLALGNVSVRLQGDPTSRREGIVAIQAAGVSWGVASNMSCVRGYTLVASTEVANSTFDDWKLDGTCNGTAGFSNGSNCPEYFAVCDGRQDPASAPGQLSPKANPVFPVMRVTRMSVGCAACGVTMWSNGTSSSGITVAEATLAAPVPSDCVSCVGRMPDGIDCGTGILTQRKRWWRASHNVDFYSKLYPCFTASCIGSANLTSGLPDIAAQCDVGYTGPVCGICTVGYTMQSGVCVQCPTVDSKAIAATVLPLFAALMFIVCLYRQRHSPWVQDSIARTILSFCQLIVTMKHSFAVVWPASYNGVLHTGSIVLGSFADLPATVCAYTVNWYGRLLAWTCGMLALVLAFWCYDKHPVSQRHRSGSQGSVMLADGTAHSNYRLVKWVFYLCYYCYPLATPVIIAVFDCRTIVGTSYMVADYRLRCDGSTYWLAVTWSVIWTLIFVIGFPSALAIALLKRHECAQFLEADYKGKAASGGSSIPRMWELVDMTRKLLLTCIIIFVPPGGIPRIAFALYVSVMYQLVLAMYQPYKSVYANRMDNAASAALSSTYFVTMLLTVRQSESDSSVASGLGVLLFALLAFVLLAGVCAVWAMRLYAKEEIEAKDSKVLGAGEHEMQYLSRRSTNADDATHLNPAYDQSTGDPADVAGARARVAELEGQIRSIVRERAEYTSTRIAAEVMRIKAHHAVNLEQVHAAHSAEVEELRAALGAKKDAGAKET